MPDDDGRLRLLITSAGSLLGQNLLDALEGRREQVYVIGTNLDACNARLFRCDKVYLTPPTDDAAAFRARVLDIIEIEQPDLWLPGRDHDVVAQAELRETHPELRALIPAGSAGAARMMQDKWLSCRFAQEYRLPFADSAIVGTNGDASAVRALAERHGFPLLAKPRLGYGSLGVFALMDEPQLERAIAVPDLVFQQFVNPPADLAAYAERLRLGLPLFSTVRETGQHCCQTVITPDGRPSEFCLYRCEVLMGRAEYVELFPDPQLERVGRQYAEAIAELGWIGSFNIQMKRTAEGGYVAFELNPRMVGSTSARLFLGYDEIGIVARLFLGPGRLSDCSLSPPPRRVIQKSLTDGVVELDQVAQLEAAGVWQARA